MKQRISSIMLAIVMVVGISTCSSYTAAAESADDPTIQEFSITWMVDGEVYDETSVAENGTITAPADPVKAPADCTIYSFAGWSDTVDGETLDTFPTATEEFTFYAVFDETANHGSVNGFEYNHYDSGTHTVQCKDCFSLEENEDTAVSCTIDPDTHKCIYCGENEVCSVVFMNGDEVFTSVTCEYGKTLGIGGMPVPSKTGYKFAGWYTQDGVWVVHGMTVTRNLTAYATWEAIVDSPDDSDDSDDSGDLDNSNNSNNNSNASTNSPKTGDNSNPWLCFALMFVSGGAIVSLTAYDRKRRTE